MLTGKDYRIFSITQFVATGILAESKIQFLREIHLCFLPIRDEMLGFRAENDIKERALQLPSGVSWGSSHLS